MSRGVLSLAAGIAFASLAMAGAASAEDFADPKACISQQIAAGAPVAECVNEVHTTCFAYEEASLAATNCLRLAKDYWGSLIAGRMEQIRAAAPEEISAIAGIEVKYDLRANLMQCDRMEELTLVQREADEETLFTRTRCEATAVGLAYVKLVLQSQGIE